jgi:hypothetical protein
MFQVGKSSCGMWVNAKGRLNYEELKLNPYAKAL